MSFDKAIEHIQITRDKFYQIENTIRLQEHIRRYASIRRFLFGNVLDFACGCGYGSFLLSSNPDVTKVVGIDKDDESISWAKEHYQTEKCTYICEDVGNVK